MTTPCLMDAAKRMISFQCDRMYFRLMLPPMMLASVGSCLLYAGVHIQTRRFTHWQNGKMVLRWMASAFIRTEKRFKRIMGHRDLRALEAIVNPSATATQKAA